MKKNILTLSLAGIALILLFASCNKENAPAPRDSVFTLHAYDAALKSSLGSDWSVAWTSADRLTVFNAASGGTTFSDNCRFVMDGDPSEGMFKHDEGETTKSLITGETAYDWYVCCPWSQYCQAPGLPRGYSVATQPKQKGYNNSDHITVADLMAGTAYNVADGTAPSVALHHLGSIMKFTITNNSGEAAAITGLTLDATEGGTYITGGFTMDWGNASTPPSLSTDQMNNHSYKAELIVQNIAGTAEIEDKVPNGESVDVYFVVAPFTIPAGGKIKITLKGSWGDQELENTFPSGISFEAGKYNTASLSYTIPAPTPENVVFEDTFGTYNGNMAGYDKSGLTTTVVGDAANYTYAQGSGSVTIKPATTANQINVTDYGTYIKGSAVRFGSASAANFVLIKGVAVKENTAYTFQYNKSNGAYTDGTEFTTATKVRWRKNGTTAFTDSSETDVTGTISYDFTTGAGVTSIDIGVSGVKNPAATGSLKYCPAVDMFRLIEK